MLMFLIVQSKKRYENSKVPIDKEVYKFIEFIEIEYKQNIIEDDGVFLAQCVAKFDSKGKKVGCPVVKKILIDYKEELRNIIFALNDIEQSYIEYYNDQVNLEELKQFEFEI